MFGITYTSIYFKIRVLFFTLGSLTIVTILLKYDYQFEKGFI